MKTTVSIDIERFMHKHSYLKIFLQILQIHGLSFNHHPCQFKTEKLNLKNMKKKIIKESLFDHV